MIKIIKNLLGEFFFTSGVGIFIYNILSFSYKGGHGGKWIDGSLSFLPQLLTRGRYEFEYVVYYYKHDTIVLVTIGAIMITLGLLIIKNKQK